MTDPKPKLLDQLRDAVRQKHYSFKTEQAYIGWCKRFILFHHKRHPAEMRETEVEQFLTHLAVEDHVAASTQNVAFNAIIFLYRHVLHIELKNINAARAKQQKYVPEIITHDECKAIIAAMSGETKLQTQLLYGAGLRLNDCLRLRIKDIDFARKKITVRATKGDKPHVTLLPDSVIAPLKEHLISIKKLHEYDLSRGYGSVYLPHALERKYPNASREWNWQYVFPAPSFSADPRSGVIRRHHASESMLQRAIRAAAKIAGVTSRVSPHTFRHCFATEYLQRAVKKHGDAMAALKQLQGYLGHGSIQTTMVYLHFLDHKVGSPLDD